MTSPLLDTALFTFVFMIISSASGTLRCFIVDLQSLCLSPVTDDYPSHDEPLFISGHAFVRLINSRWPLTMVKVSRTQSLRPLSFWPPH